MVDRPVFEACLFDLGGRAMVSWQQFADQEPELAAYGWDLLREETGYAYLATVSASGAPRVHPVVPFVAEGNVYIAIVASSPKVADLRREPRYMLHATVGDNDTEFAMRGRAVEVTDPALEQRLCASQELNTVTMQSAAAYFALSLDRVDAAIWDDGPPRRQTWRAVGA